jgi:5-methylcytosine-specific restriction endonuclease McrBC regulatory subunit McrC
MFKHKKLNQIKKQTNKFYNSIPDIIKKHKSKDHLSIIILTSSTLLFQI